MLPVGIVVPVTTTPLLGLGRHSLAVCLSFFKRSTRLDRGKILVRRQVLHHGDEPRVACALVRTVVRVAS